MDSEEEINDINRDSAVLLLCDLALILLDETTILQAGTLLKSFLSDRQSVLLAGMIQALFEDETIQTTYSYAYDLINQYRKNRKFANRKERRYIVTATVSTGKSTLINAIIGKPVTRSSQEACTANLCYLYNKPFEDNAIHLFDSRLNLRADYNDLTGTVKSEVSHVASYFRMWEQSQRRVCIIDTPGVNSAQNRDHGKISRKALTEERHDNLLYVLNANRLGVDDEYGHLKYVSENVPKEKTIFILNKLDNFRKTEDSIEVSIASVRNDLNRFGYENPVICPMSAYFALLIKMKQNGEPLDENEEDAYNFYVRKYSKPEYDLSRYYETFGVETKNADVSRV
jgi:predicted GTPase